MKESGLKISSTDSVFKDGKMEPTTKGSTGSDENMERVNLSGLMGLPSKGTLWAMELKEEESTDGMMGENMMDSGRRIKCMGMVHSDGLMVECIEATMLWMRRKAMESLNGLMDGSMKDTGTMECSMVKEF